MSTKLECPICESTISVDLNPESTQVMCPECKRQFHFSDSFVIKDLDVPTIRKESESVPNSESKDVSSKLDVAAVGSNQDPIESIAGDLPSRAPRKRNKTPAVGIIIGLALLAVGLLVSIPFVMQISRNKVEEIKKIEATPILIPPKGEAVQRREAKKDNDKLPFGIKDGQPNRSGGDGLVAKPDTDPDADSVSKTQAKKRLQPPPDAKLKYYSRKQMERVAQSNFPRIVRLRVFNALGKNDVVGTLVDSRGWVVTSLRAIAGARKIEVLQTVPDFDRFKKIERFSDEVRGVLATDPVNDLALLEVNRQFVVSLSELEISREDTLVGFQYLITFEFPDSQSPLVYRETQVENRLHFDKHKSDIQMELERNQLLDQSVKWITHIDSGPTNEIVAGAPLFSKDGQLLGINTAAKTEKFRLAVPGVRVHDLIVKAGETPKSILTLNENIDALGTGILDSSLITDADSKAYSFSSQINRTGVRCRKMNWKFGNQDDYGILQSLMEHIIKASSGHTNAEENEVLNNQADFWSQNILAGLSLELPKKESDTADEEPDPELPDAIKQINSFAMHSIMNEDRPIALYVKVWLTAIDSPSIRDEETVTLQILGTDKLINLPFEPSLRMLPGATWLVICNPVENQIAKFRFGEDEEDHASFISSMISARELK